MMILVNQLRGLLLTAITRVVFFVHPNFPVHPWLWVSLFVFLVSAIAYKTFIPDVLRQVGSPPPFFSAARSSLVTRIPDIVAKLLIFRDKLVAVTELDAVIACTDAIANEKQVLLAKIVELESANVTLSNKLQMNEMATAWLEEQIAMKTESQNEILEDMGTLEDELEAVRAELNAANATIIELETKLCDSSMNVISLEHQIALKTEAQNELLEGMDHLEDELKTAKVKIQETAAQKDAIERDLVELRELTNREETIMSTEPPAPSEFSFDLSNPRSVVNPHKWQLNTPPSSPQKSLLFGSAKASFTRNANVSPTSSRFRLPSIRIPSRREGVADSTKKSSSVRHGIPSASPNQIHRS